ncbi:hypothetical protein K6U06_05855 [Acidiferrimicrobium sp. IK]|uniref:hypothetical protein n=1 Tax=Acidiferrimicrobium sp. IK TaxID=2871700 RepID=UPI0021CB574C|nr:hypothetical protein [Acidiferrimicrobium sp. IK]MCU4183877.1 hypothetical protein [Acidiferrimicrobium sp. IK]
MSVPLAGQAAQAIRSSIEWTTDIDPLRRRAVVDAVAALRAAHAMLYNRPSDESSVGRPKTSDAQD